MTITTLFSPKGGSGTTTIAAALAVLASRHATTVVVDAAEHADMAPMLGLPDQGGPGFMEWAKAHDSMVGLGYLGVQVSPDLTLIPHGEGKLDTRDVVTTSRIGDRLQASVGDLSLVVDCGSNADLAACGDEMLMVLRPCYLALRRTLASSAKPTGLVLVEEPGRSLDSSDIEDVLGVRVAAVVPWDAGIARSVDSGLLGARIPQPLKAALAARLVTA